MFAEDPQNFSDKMAYPDADLETMRLLETALAGLEPDRGDAAAMRNDNRGPWYLITGLVVGIIIGVLVAWVVQPVNYTNTNPASLRADYQRPVPGDDRRSVPGKRRPGAG